MAGSPLRRRPHRHHSSYEYPVPVRLQVVMRGHGVRIERRKRRAVPVRKDHVRLAAVERARNSGKGRVLREVVLVPRRPDHSKRCLRRCRQPGCISPARRAKTAATPRTADCWQRRRRGSPGSNCTACWRGTFCCCSGKRRSLFPMPPAYGLQLLRPAQSGCRRVRALLIVNHRAGLVCFRRL